MKKNLLKKIDKNYNYYIFNLTLILLHIIPPLLGLIWLFNMDKIKCECSNNNKWHNDYIKIYFIVCVLFIIIQIIIFINNDHIILINNLILRIIAFIYNIISTFIILLYIYNLKKNNCECSYSLIKDITYIVYILFGINLSFTLPSFLVTIYELLKK